MAFCGLDGRNDLLYKGTEAGGLGPGSYDPKPGFGQNNSPKRKPSRVKQVAFGTVKAKELNKLGGSQYSPGPGFYNFNKYKSSFVKEYMKSEQD